MTLGLPKNHVWESAGAINAQGEGFLPNMPTEEVFTAPDFRRAEGYVTSTKPLSYNGNIIEGIKVTLKMEKLWISQLKKAIKFMKDLVFKSKERVPWVNVPSYQIQAQFPNQALPSLTPSFDENASNHLAIGAAYATSVEGGAELTEEELEAAGLNRSDVHVDFMIGPNQMDIDGIREDGTRVPVFRNGDWAI